MMVASLNRVLIEFPLSVGSSGSSGPSGQWWPAYFLATTSTTQSISAVTETEINVGTETADALGIFSSNRLTVPAYMNGGTAVLSAGILFGAGSGANVVRLAIQVSADGGTNWEDVAAQESHYALDLDVSVIVPMLAGEIYRVAVTAGTSMTVADSDMSFFGGVLVP